MESVNLNDVKIGYFRVDAVKRTGFICVALQRPAKNSGSRLYKAAFSFYSPNETEKSFTKKMAREIAIGRLSNFKRSFNGRIEFNSEIDLNSDNFTITNVMVEALHVAMEKSVAMKNSADMEKSIVPGWVLRNKEYITVGLREWPV